MDSALDIWIKLFDESDIKEQIRILSISKRIRDHIYSMYGGKEVVDHFLAARKEARKAVVTKFVRFMNGPFTALNTGKLERYPEFERVYRANPHYPSQFVKRCFEQGLRAHHMYEGKSMFKHMLDAILFGNEILRTTPHEIDKMFAVCMNRVRFQRMINWFIAIRSCKFDECKNGMIRGYLIRYARNNGFDTSDIDEVLQWYSPEPYENLWECTDEDDFKKCIFSNLAYYTLEETWEEYEDTKETVPFVDHDVFYSVEEIEEALQAAREEVESAREEAVAEISKEIDEEIDFDKILRILRTYALKPSDIRTYNERTPLMEACRLGKEHIVEQLIKMGVNLEKEVDAYGWTPEMYAEESPETCQRILNQLRRV